MAILARDIFVKKLHIVNIGLPRCGTTWLWRHANFGPYKDKENRILLKSPDFDGYKKHYQQYEVSANFNPNLWFLDREIVKFLAGAATHVTVILRNPFDFVERYVDYIDPQGLDVAGTTDFVIGAGYIKYHAILRRWADEIADPTRFKIFLFEDLAKDSRKFFVDYMDFCGLTERVQPNVDYSQKINYNINAKKLKIDFSAGQIQTINQQITLFKSWIDQDISHWTR